MNDQLLPPLPPPPPPFHPKKPGMSRAGAAALGLLLFLVTTPLCVFTHGFSITVGFFLAFVSLFFDGYRYIFVGYILSAFLTVGVLLLLLIQACSNLHM